MSSIQVCIRMRPFLEGQKKLEKDRIILQQKNKKVKVQLTEQKQKIFKFNYVMSENVSQSQLYSNVNILKLIERVVEGYHSTIFAYGQTGSGKTYTIEGADTKESQGVIPKAFQDLFTIINTKMEKQQNNRGFRVFLSYIQIYNQSIFDLIDPGQGKPLKMRWNKHQQFTVQNLFQCQCRTLEDALKWWKKGQKNKILGSHKMNNASSRSHCMLTLRLQSYSLDDPSQQIQSKLQIVDLAGSERHKVTKSQGVVFKEGIQINKSLFTLRQVITSLYETSTSKSGQLPPYRDSKLTSLLKHSIGGDSYCLMIACLNPSMAHFQESLQTLTYASMASYINNAPTINLDPKIKQNEQLKHQITILNKQIKNLQDNIQFLTKIIQSNECTSCSKRKKSQPTQPQQTSMFPKIIDRPKYHTIEDSSVLSLSSNSPSKSIKTTKDIFESINMIRDLATSNSILRQKLQNHQLMIDKQQKQIFNLMKQNQAIRERLQSYNKSNKYITQPSYYTEYNQTIYEQQQDKSRIQRYKSLVSHKSQQNRIAKRKIQIDKINYNDFLMGKKDIHIKKRIINSKN